MIPKFKGPLENWTKRPKTLLIGLKALLFVSCHMKDNVDVIHFHTKCRGREGEREGDAKLRLSEKSV